MAEDSVINPSTGNLDKIGKSASDVVADDARYLKIDQTASQTVTHGTPTFAKGIIIKADEWVYLDG